MRALAPAWPPKERQSITITRKPSEAAYTAVARPAGPAPTTTTSNSSSCSMVSTMPRQRASALSVGLTMTRAVGAGHEQFRLAVLFEQRCSVRILRRVDHG